MAVTIESLKATMESMANQFKGFQEMMVTSLDKLSVLEAWRVTTEESMDMLLQRSTETTAWMDETVARIKSLEFRPPLLPPPPPPVHWQHPHPPPPPHPSMAGIDINVALGASSSATPPRVDSPMGSGMG
jgi:hypothetical protein